MFRDITSKKRAAKELVEAKLEAERANQTKSKCRFKFEISFKF